MVSKGPKRKGWEGGEVGGEGRLTWSMKRNEREGGFELLRANGGGFDGGRVTQPGRVQEN